MSRRRKGQVILRYVPKLDGWYAGGGEETRLSMLPTDEYTKRFNGGEFRDGKPEGSTYWTERAGHNLTTVTENYPTEGEGSIIPVPAGMYSLTKADGYGIGVRKYATSTDKYVELSGHAEHIVEDIDFFLANRDKWKGLGLLHRRGVLLYGPAGTGKTMLLEHICEKYQGATRVVFVPAHMDAGDLANIRGGMADMPTIFVFEELCSSTNSDQALSELLSFLDGEDSWDNSLTIATTNYAYKLPRNVVDRPGRFDRLYKMGPPEKAARVHYIRHMMPTLSEEEVDTMAKLTKGLSLAYLKELTVSINIYGRDAETTVAEFNERRKRVEKEFAEPKGIGFGRETSDSDEDDDIPVEFQAED